MNKFPDLFESPFLRLESINRFSNRHLLESDTDSEHSIRLQLYLLEAYSCTKAFNIKEACYKALVHDLDEIGCCDIPRPVKYRDSKIKEEIKRVTNELLKEMHLDESLLQEIQDAKDETVEGNLVRFFDVVDAFRTLNLEAWRQHSIPLTKDAEDSLQIIRSLENQLNWGPQILRDYISQIVRECERVKINLE